MMKQKKLALAVALIFMCTLCMGSLAEGLQEAQPLQDTFYYPEGATAEDAILTFTYAYPQFADDSDEVQNINSLYQYELDDMLLFTAPMFTEEAELSGEGPASMAMSYQITCNNDDYLSILFTKEQCYGAAATETLQANIFGRQGAEAGQVVTLPNILGLLDYEETDERRVDRAILQASNLVYDLVWDIICQQLTDGSDAYYDEIIREDLEAEFYPESDFYMDGEGNLVFYIQAGMISNNAAGVLYYPFSLAELLREL